MRRPTPSPTSTRSLDLTRPQLRLNLVWTDTHPFAVCSAAGGYSVSWCSTSLDHILAFAPPVLPGDARRCRKSRGRGGDTDLAVELGAEDRKFGRREGGLGVDGGWMQTSQFSRSDWSGKAMGGGWGDAPGRVSEGTILEMKAARGFDM